MLILNERPLHADRLQRRLHILREFPDERFEAVVVQWDRVYPPTVLLQLRENLSEPLKFAGQRPQIPGNAELPRDAADPLDSPLHDFVDAATGKPFEREAFLADVLFSRQVFDGIRQGDGTVLPAQTLWELRVAALEALHLADEPGLAGTPQG